MFGEVFLIRQFSVHPPVIQALRKRMLAKLAKKEVGESLRKKAETAWWWLEHECPLGKPWENHRKIWRFSHIWSGWWWLEHFSIYWKQSSQLTNIFQRVWNHQSAKIPLTVSYNGLHSKLLGAWEHLDYVSIYWIVFTKVPNGVLRISW